MAIRNPLSLRRINVFRRDDGKKIIESKRRDMSRGAPAVGVKSFTKKANARSKDAARARNRAARKSRKVNRTR